MKAPWKTDVLPDPTLDGRQLANDLWLAHLEEPHTAEVSFEAVLMYVTAASTRSVSYSAPNAALGWPLVLKAFGPEGSEVSTRLPPAALDSKQRQILGTLLDEGRARRRRS